MCVAVWKIAGLLILCELLVPVGTLAQRPQLEPIVFSQHPEADPSGTYLGHAPASDAAQRVFTLNLEADGTATLTTVFIGKDNATEHGRWKQTGNEVELTFDPMGPNQPPRPIIFRHRDHKLSPIHWDASEWGRSGPPTLHWAGPTTTSSAGFMQGGS